MLSRVQLFTTPWTIAHQAALSMRFSQQEYSSGELFPPPGVFQTQGSNLHLLPLPHFQVDFLLLEPLAKSHKIELVTKKFQKYRSQGPNSFTGEFYQTSKEELTSAFLKLFQKIAEGKMLPNSIYKNSITLIPKQITTYMCNLKNKINKQNRNILINTENKLKGIIRYKLPAIRQMS